MSFDYINEAFRKLNALNENIFDTSLTGLNTLSNFLDEDDTTDLLKVIDPSAATSDELSDSYVGKVIINCNVCHSHIFENKEDVVIDEDGIVNPDMQCPYCGEDSGFTIIGEISPYTREDEDEGETDESETEDHAESEEDVTESETELEESFNHDSVMDSFTLLKNFLKSKGHTLSRREASAYMWSVIDLFEAGDVEVTQDTLEDWYIETKRNFPEDLELLESVDHEESPEVVTEDVNSVNVETDDSVVNVHTEDDGKVVVTTEPKDSETESDRMVVAPVSDETVQSIESNNGISEDEPFDLETESEEADTESEDNPEEIDIDIDEVDEDSLDELGESYLKNIYENVESFKTSKVSTTDSKMIVEGTIAFKSGLKKNTGFIFEAHSASQGSKVRFRGLNEHMSSDKSAFLLQGVVKDGKFLPESLTYNYKVGTNNIKGTVSKK